MALDFSKFGTPVEQSSALDFSKFGTPVQPPPEKQSAFRQIADVPLGIAKGAVQGVRMIADAFGAGSDTSKTIKSAETYLADLMSAQAKDDQQEISRIMKDAEDKGVLDQVKAGLKAFTVAPVDTLSSALGTAAPVIVGALGAKVLGAGALVGTGVSALTGAGMGAGAIKGSIYEETKDVLKKAGASEEEAERRAQLAQEYGGKNLDQILLGTVLGGAAAVGPLEKGGAAFLARKILGKTGVEATESVAEQTAKGALRRRAEAGLLEAAPEALQAGQEQVAQNIALQREGFEDVPTFRGAFSAATMEALAGFGLGTTIGGGRPEVAPAPEPAPAPKAPDLEAPRTGPLTPEEQLELERQRAAAERPKTTEELLAETGIQTGRPTTAEDIARIRDEHETAVIEGLLAQDAEMKRANDWVAAEMERVNRLDELRDQARDEEERQAIERRIMDTGIKDVDSRIRETRILSRVQDLIDRNIPFASTAINEINQKFGVINEAPLNEEERARIENIMGMVNTFTNFVNLPVLAPKPVDRFAENQAMEALIKERTERGQAEPLRAAPPAPSPRIEEAPVSQGVGEGTTLRPTSGVEPSVAEDRELVTAPKVPAVEPTIEAPRAETAAAIETTPTVETPKVVTVGMLTDLGVKPTAAVVKRLEGTSIDDPKVAADLESYANRYAPPEVKPQILNFVQTLRQPEAAKPVTEAPVASTVATEAPAVEQPVAPPISEPSAAPKTPAEPPVQTPATSVAETPAGPEVSAFKPVEPVVETAAPTVSTVETPEAVVPKSKTATGQQAGWVLRNKNTGEVVMETNDPAKVKALNTEKYEAVPIAQYLASLSKPQKPTAPKAEAPAVEAPAAQKAEAPVGGFRRATAREADSDNAQFVYDVGNGARLLFVPSQNGDVYVAAPGKGASLVVRTGDNRDNVIKTVDQFPDYIPENIRQIVLDYHKAVQGKTTDEEQTAVAMEMAEKIEALTAPKAKAPAAPPVLDTTGIKEVKGRHPQVQAAAQLLQDKKMTREEFEKYVDYYKPIQEVEAEKLLPPTSEQRMNETVNADKRDKINVPVADGTKVGLRMDLPARERGGSVVSIHEGKPGKLTVGKLMGFRSTGWLKDVTFEVRSQEKGLAVATGAAKAPQQTVEGTWFNLSPEETYARVKELMKDPAWTQVGFDPSRHGYFYDRKTREPVVSASEMYQVGQFLLAKNVKYAPKTDFLYSLGKEQTKQLQDFQQTLRNLLNKFGLKDVGLNIEEGMRDAGSYSQQLIRIALDEANPIRTLRHEAIHALRELGFFTDAQWKSLSKMAKDKWIDQYLKQRNEQGRPLKAGEESRYDAYMREYNGDMEKITEEAVADAFADFDATKPPAGMLQALLKRMRDLFQSIKSALTKIESPEQIFGKVEKGELKPGEKRQAGERKSVRDRATANFLRWFGDSKVVDEKGEPLVVYHGTRGDFTEFKPSRVGAMGPGIYFTTKPDVASGYSDVTTRKGQERGGAQVIPVYLSVKNPLVIDSVNDSSKQLFNRIDPTGKLSDDEVIAKLIDQGYDAVYAKEDGEYVVFNPTQIKSAIGNNGEYSLTNADIRKSLGKVTAAAQKALQKQPMPEKGLSHVSKDLTNLAQPIFFPQNKTILDRIDGMKDRFWQRLAQKTADQFRTIKEYSPLGYMQARLSKSIDGSLEGLLFHGQVFDDGGALNIKKDTKGLMEVLKPIGTELDSFLMWVALNRESTLPDTKRSKIPNMDKLVARRAEFAAGELNGKPRVEVYQDVLKQMNQLNKSVLDIALAKGLINQEGYDKFIKDIYYIPFYKKMEEDGTIEGAQTASGLTSQYFSKELKGSEAPFGDLMENIVRNWSHILSASMKNAAAKTTIDDAMKLQAAEPNLKAGLEMRDGVVYSTKSDKPIEAKFDEDGKQLYAEGELRPDLTTSGTGMAKIMVDGQPMYFKITDELLMDSISSIGYMGPKSKFVLVMRDFKNMLQYGVTASPIFKVNNLIRDSVSALAVSDLKKSPVYNVMTGISLSKKDSPTYISALAGGGIFNFGSAYEGDQAKLIKRLLDQGVDGDTILDTKEKITKALKKTWDAYQHLGDRSEAANRLALYQQMRDKGMSHLQASFMARDLLDFSMQGSWPTFRFLTQIVPFMNARIQGLYKLGRDGINPTVRVLYNATTGKEIDANDKVRAAQFSTVTAAVMLASAMLYLSFKDDEDFKKRDAWDRDNFWWFKIPSLDIAFRIPKPFEVGAFGTLVERTLEQIVDEGAEGKQFGDSLWKTLWDTFSLNPTPQIVKPLVDIYANKDSFSGAPIESAGLERLSKQERKTDTTSPLAIALGGVSTLFPEKFQVSPVQMDYAIKGYFGWLGAMASMASTYAVMPFKEGEYPDARWLDRASLGLVRDLPAPQSAYVTAFYENAKEISQAYADMRHYREIGDAEKVQELLEEKGDKIALAKFYDKTSKNIANVRKQIQFITNDKTLDGATKKEEIERMKLIMSDLAKQAEEVRKSMKP